MEVHETFWLHFVCVCTYVKLDFPNLVLRKVQACKIKYYYIFNLFSEMWSILMEYVWPRPIFLFGCCFWTKFNLISACWDVKKLKESELQIVFCIISINLYLHPSFWNIVIAFWHYMWHHSQGCTIIFNLFIKPMLIYLSVLNCLQLI